MERYLGHTCGDRVQTVKEHLEGTAVLSGEFASRFGKRDWGYCCGLLHDIGKYSAAFQKKITENSDRRVDHSSAGMQVCFEKGGMYGFMGYCIAGHHAGLPNYGVGGEKGSWRIIRLTGTRSRFPNWHPFLLT